MIFLGVLLMLFGFISKNIAMWVTAFLIALLVRYFAYDLLFKEYEERLEILRKEHKARRGG